MEETKMNLEKNRTLALKIFAEAFLLGQGNTKTEEMFANRKIGENFEVSDEEAYVLHHYLLEEYNAMGLDLNKIIEEKGEKVEAGKLSNYELAELIRRADNMLININVFKKYGVKNK